jgi:D-inositol-3-phosphate glycosyltransferase
MPRKRLLWVGDACVSTGFARATHYILQELIKNYDIFVLGIGYNGDPHPYPYSVYTCFPGGDIYGLGRLPLLVEMLHPDIIILQNDPWNIQAYVKVIRSVDKNVPIMASLAVDGLNCRGNELNDLELAIFWTEFGRKQAVLGGYLGKSAVIPLGVDRDIYQPVDQYHARALLDYPNPEFHLDTAFVIGNINRNQPRKRLDLTLAYFAEWIHTHHVKDAFLFLHVCPTMDKGYDIRQLARYYDIRGRVILAEPDAGYGVDESTLVQTYGTFSVQVSTSQGEGMGLTTLEGMACGIPQIVPDWAALGKKDGWTDGAVFHVPCTSTIATPGSVNSIGGVVDKVQFIDALHFFYSKPNMRMRFTEAALRCASRPEFRWETVGQAFNQAISQEQMVTVNG